MARRMRAFAEGATRNSSLWFFNSLFCLLFAALPMEQMYGNSSYTATRGLLWREEQQCWLSYLFD
jgi:hypothetical protein